jgi:hypothetical protein
MAASRLTSGFPVRGSGMLLSQARKGITSLRIAVAARLSRVRAWLG